MNKRGRKPPIHEPLICTTCGDPPVMRDGKLLPCECSQTWNLDLIRNRLPKWAAQLQERV